MSRRKRLFQRGSGVEQALGVRTRGDADEVQALVRRQGARERRLAGAGVADDRDLAHRYGASEKSAKSKPGETTQATSVATSERPGAAVCHSSARTRYCPPAPSSQEKLATGDESKPPTVRSTGPPPCHSHSSSERTRCHAERSPGSSGNDTHVASDRSPRSVATVDGCRHVSRYQPPSG